jgi:hypothetical protein
MLDLILKYQQPRITYYVNKLRNAFKFADATTCATQDQRPRLSEEWVQKLPALHTRSWIDDNENEFQFSGEFLNEADNISRAALSAQSLKEINRETDIVFELLDQISLDESEDGRASLLKQLLPSLFSIWRSPRFQASIKSRLCTRFQNFPNSEKRQNEAFTALKFLCRVYYSFDTFIQAAESIIIFKSVEIIAVPLRSATPKKAAHKLVREEATPLEIANNLGLYVRGVGWLQHLESRATKNKFRKFRGERHHVHAEIQLLSYQSQFFNPRQENEHVHHYIGCSKLCCLLCWLLLRAHGAFQVRGTHETIMHRWEIPGVLLTNAHTAEYKPVLQDFLCFIKRLLQTLFDLPYPLRHPNLLAQSSAALSTTQTVLDREKAQMEKPELNMRLVH